MLKKYSKFLKNLFIALDSAIIFASWILAYEIRFRLKLVPVFDKVPTFEEHLGLFILILPVFILFFNWSGLYNPMRISKIKKEIAGIFKASSIALFVVVTVLYFFRKNYHYSRLTFLYFWVINIFFVSLFREVMRKILKFFRKKGYNLRHVLIIGSGELAKKIAGKINEHPEFGLKISGFLGKGASETGKEIVGAKVIGIYQDLKNILNNKPPDQVIFALSPEDEGLMRPVLESIANEAVDIRIVFDFDEFFTLGQALEDLDGLPIITLRDNPLSAGALFTKRVLDLMVSFLVLVITAPFMILCAIIIKLTSKGQVFYKQERISFNGRKFILYKFRSMRLNAEKDTGPVFTKVKDKRITRIGKVMRRFSIDELPQILNVLKGDMSLVGPRPERTEFVDEFRKFIPWYMLRHKIKEGMTGWAQVNGLRGNASIEKRIEYDLYYMKNWSPWLDFKILFLTIPAIFKGEGAY